MTLLQRKSVTHFFENVTVFLGILQGGIRWELDFRIIYGYKFYGVIFCLARLRSPTKKPGFPQFATAHPPRRKAPAVDSFAVAPIPCPKG